MMARLMYFYPGLSRNEFWSMPMNEINELVDHMNEVNQQAKQAQQAQKARARR